MDKKQYYSLQKKYREIHRSWDEIVICIDYLWCLEMPHARKTHLLNAISDHAKAITKKQTEFFKLVKKYNDAKAPTIKKSLIVKSKRK